MVSWLIFAHKHEVGETKVLQEMSEGAGMWQAKSSGTVISLQLESGLCQHTARLNFLVYVCLKVMLLLALM